MTPHRARSEKLLRTIAFLCIASLLSVSGFSVAQADPAAITRAQKDAQELTQLIDELDADLSQASEDYNYATEQLKETQAAEAQTQTSLKKATSQLDAAQQQLMRRLADIYKNGRGSALEVLFESSSFSDLANRAAQLSRISRQDSELVADVEDRLAEVQKHQSDLAEQKKGERKRLDGLAQAKQEVQAQLAVQQKVLQGKETQIAQLQREEQARQAELAAAARAAAAAQAEQSQLHPAGTTSVTVGRAPASPSTTTRSATTKVGAKPKTTTTAKPATSTTAKPTTATTSRPKTTTIVKAPSSSGGSNTSSTRAKVIDIATQYLGSPYSWSGASPGGFDCSGFVMYVFAKVGISLPHSSSMQYGRGTHISRSQLKPGDLVFFYSPIHHVGIYIGDGRMINSRTGGVRIDDAFWSSYVGATRIIE